MPIVNMSSRRPLQEATARRAAKRQRSVEEQKKIDSEQESSRKAAEAAGGGDGAFCVVKPFAMVEKDTRGGAVQQASVQMRQPVMQRQAARDRSLAGGGRPVDGDNHAARFTPKLHGGKGAPRPLRRR